MAYVRQLDSGLWAATYRAPGGKRPTITRELKSQVLHDVGELERQVRTGEWIDPALAEATVSQWWERVRESRRLEKASRARDDSHWRCHVEPYWGRWKLGAILKPDVSTWVVSMERRGVGAATIQGSLGVLRAVLEQAVDARRIRSNPAIGVSAPRRNAHLDRILEPHEDELILDNLDSRFPGRPDARLFIETLLDHGLRWEEAAAIDREHVDTRQRLFHIGPVVERDGTIRPYPKSPAGVRPVPISDEIWPRIRDRALVIKPGGLMFPAPRGGVLHYSSWHDRVWQRGLCVDVEDPELVAKAAARRPGTSGPRPRTARLQSILDDPQPTPHDLRHTYGTRLAEAGVPIHDIMALMGHEDMESAQRYLHSRDDRFDRARQAMNRSRAARVSRS